MEHIDEYIIDEQDLRDVTNLTRLMLSTYVAELDAKLEMLKRLKQNTYPNTSTEIIRLMDSAMIKLDSCVVDLRNNHIVLLVTGPL